MPPLRDPDSLRSAPRRWPDQFLVPRMPDVMAGIVYHRTMAVEAKQLDSGVGVITISGRLALGGETERLDAAIKGMLQKDVKTFVLDITGLDYVDSSGIGMLVSCLTNAKKAGGELKLVGANPRIKRIFSMTGVDSIMSMYGTMAEATA